MKNAQPVWKEIYRRGDSSSDIITYLEDTTKVYDPELRIFIRDENKLYSIVAEKCYVNNGILSDNKYHLDYPTWYADKVYSLCEYMGLNPVSFIANLCSDDIILRCHTYYNLAMYFNPFEFDQYPTNGLGE